VAAPLFFKKSKTFSFFFNPSALIETNSKSVHHTCAALLQIPEIQSHRSAPGCP